MFGLLGFGLLFSYQNCSEVSFEKMPLMGLGDRDGFEIKLNEVILTEENHADIDILFVVDNSGSMANYQKNMASRIQGFMNHVQDLNYRIAVTSTAPVESGSSGPGDGILTAFGSGKDRFLILDPQGVQSPAEAENFLGQAIQMGWKGSGHERGINALYRSLERDLLEGSLVNGGHKQFFRDDAALAVVLISDEDECSTGELSSNNCTNHSPVFKSEPAELLALVENLWGKNKAFAFHSIIHPEGAAGEACPEKHSAARYGKTYDELSQLTGGVVGSVCEANYADQLSRIGERTESLLRSVTLDCEPQDPDNQGGAKISIYKNGQPISVSYKVDGRRLTFAAPLTKGTYDFAYYCLEKSSGG